MAAFLQCDLTHALEDSSIGGIVIAIIWALWSWYKRHHASAK
jgi:hypothetical protein